MKTAYTLIILMMLGFFAMANSVMANETVNTVVNGVKETPTKVFNFVKSEWNETKEFQKAGWEQGKKQNADNWNKLKSLLGLN